MREKEDERDVRWPFAKKSLSMCTFQPSYATFVCAMFGSGEEPSGKVSGKNREQDRWQTSGSVVKLSRRGDRTHRVIRRLHEPRDYGGNADGRGVLIPPYLIASDEHQLLCV